MLWYSERIIQNYEVINLAYTTSMINFCPSLQRATCCQSFVLCKGIAQSGKKNNFLYAMFVFITLFPHEWLHCSSLNQTGDCVVFCLVHLRFQCLLYKLSSKVLPSES